VPYRPKKHRASRLGPSFVLLFGIETISAMHKRTWDEAFRCVPHPTTSPPLLIVMSEPPPRTPTRQPSNRTNPGPSNIPGATPTRGGTNFLSSTNLGHTQQEIKSSLWGRILKNHPGFVDNLIKPHLVESSLVDAIEHAIDESTELKTARRRLIQNAVPEKQMYAPMVSVYVDYCCQSGSEYAIDYTASSYLYLRYAARSPYPFADQRTGPNSERSNPIRLHHIS
jgi:hypothetical protein